MIKKQAEDFSELDSIINSLFDTNISTSTSISLESTPELEKYQIPIRVTMSGDTVSDSIKPTIIGTFAPGKYINEKHKGGHYGMDFAAPKDTPIYPIASGTVTKTNVYAKGGNTCHVQHEDGIVSYYAHMNRVYVNVGQKVNQNTVLGGVGNTGNAKDTSPHLHLEVFLNQSNINPHTLFGKIVGTFSKIASMTDYMKELFERSLIKSSNITRKEVLQKKSKYLRRRELKRISKNSGEKILEYKIDNEIEISPQEQSIFDILLGAIRDKAPDITVRVAGGWVRDKLLGKQSHDIDVVVDKISGKQFAEIVKDWMSENNIPVSKDVISVDANTEANKHMESAMLPILGMNIDFAQLRKEVYDDISRNPQIEVGVSAEEDAKRRDLTINSLFYNINTGQVEDFVGGIEDLKRGIARTPIDPIKTYIDDPLRLLRLIRFSAKYGLEPDETIFEAAKDSRIINSLKNKISKERIWSELVGQEEKGGWKRGILIGPQFDKALELLNKLGLWDILFTPSKAHIENAIKSQKKPIMWTKEFTSWDMPQNHPKHDLNVKEHTLAALRYLNRIDNDKSLSNKQVKDAKDLVVRNLAMLFHDIGKCDTCIIDTHEEGHSTYKGHNESSAIMAEQILKDLRAPNDIIERVKKLIRYHQSFHTEIGPQGIRRIVRDLGSKQDADSLVEMSLSDSAGKKQQELTDEQISHYNTIAKIIDEYFDKADQSGLIKPQISGDDIMSILKIKPGKQVGEIVKALESEILSNPDMTKEEQIKFIEKFR